MYEHCMFYGYPYVSFTLEIMHIRIHKCMWMYVTEIQTYSVHLPKCAYFYLHSMGMSVIALS